VLYELLTGERLFTGDNDLVIMHRVLHMKIAGTRPCRARSNES
jgi:hypothetical protein